MKKITPLRLFYLGFLLKAFLFHSSISGTPLTISNLSSSSVMLSFFELCKHEKNNHILLINDGKLGLRNYTHASNKFFLNKDEAISLDLSPDITLVLSIGQYDNSPELTYFFPIQLIEGEYLRLVIDNFSKQLSNETKQQGLKLRLADTETGYSEMFLLAQETSMGLENFIKKWLSTLSQVADIMIPDDVEFGTAPESDHSEPSDSEE